MLRTLAKTKVWLSQSKDQKFAAMICVPCRSRTKRGCTVDEEHVRSVPEEWKRLSQLDNLNLSDLKPQYRHIDALNDAPEQVRKIFTLKFGTEEEKYEAKYLAYGEKLQRHKHDHVSLEMRITQLTIKIRKIQEDIARMLYEKKEMRLKLQSMIKFRTDLLLDLRSKSFERYCLVMKVLDLHIIFPPEYDVKLTPRAKNIADMKLRSFAEAQRIEEENERKSKEVSQLQSRILEKLKSGELVYTEDDPL